VWSGHSCPLLLTLTLTPESFPIKSTLKTQGANVLNLAASLPTHPAVSVVPSSSARLPAFSAAVSLASLAALAALALAWPLPEAVSAAVADARSAEELASAG
jgi:hypothetical protein